MIVHCIQGTTDYDDGSSAVVSPGCSQHEYRALYRMQPQIQVIHAYQPEPVPSDTEPEE